MQKGLETEVTKLRHEVTKLREKEKDDAARIDHCEAQFHALEKRLIEQENLSTKKQKREQPLELEPPRPQLVPMPMWAHQLQGVPMQLPHIIPAYVMPSYHC